jgi:hypothetical protein
MHIINSKNIKRKASIELMREARKQYEGNIEIRNITITGGWSGLELLNILGYLVGVGAGGGLTGVGAGFYNRDWGTALFYSGIASLTIPLFVGNTQRITATGDVILVSGGAMTFQANQQGIEEALGKPAKTLVDGMPRDSTIAILSVYSTDRETSEYVIDELEYRLVDARKFKIVDRRRLEQIRREQNFQLSGDVDDSSAVSIGNMLGASIVITGAISGSGASRRLVLKALDVKTAQIVTMARERFEVAPAKVAGTPARVANTPAEVAGAPAKVAETPARVAETPAKVAGTPAKVAGTPARVAETPARVAGTPAKVAEAPAEVAGTPVRVAGVYRLPICREAILRV